MDKKPKKKLIAPLVIWDLAWKLLAIRRAVQRREYKWVAGLAVSNTVGLVPMYYLWRTRGAEAGLAEPEPERWL